MHPRPAAPGPVVGRGDFARRRIAQLRYQRLDLRHGDSRRRPTALLRRAELPIAPVPPHPPFHRRLAEGDPRGDDRVAAVARFIRTHHALPEHHRICFGHRPSRSHLDPLRKTRSTQTHSGVSATTAPDYRRDRLHPDRPPGRQSLLSTGVPPLRTGRHHPDQQSKPRRVRRRLRRPGHRHRHPRPPVAPLRHRQHPRRQLPAQREDEGGLAQVEDHHVGGHRLTQRGDFQLIKGGHVT